MLALMADRATWTKRVEAWRASGLSQAKFAARAGCEPSTLKWWAWRLRRESRSVVRVVRAEIAPEHAEAAAIIIELGDARVVVPVGFDRGALRDVLDVLRGPEGRS